MNDEFIRPFYLEQLDSKNLQKFQEYIFGLKQSDYRKELIPFTDNYIGQHFDGYRSCEIHYPKRSSIFFQVGKEIFNQINKKYYRYDLRNAFEFQLLKYKEGGNYNWHCDYGTSPHRGLVRKLSMSIQLSNSDEYEGGELQLIDYSNHTITVSRDCGSVVVFDSKLPHKAWPVTFGTRYVLVGWASGPRLR